MNPDPVPQPVLDFEAANARVAELEAEARWRAIKLGVRGTAKVADDPQLQESIAKQALLEQYLHDAAEQTPRPKGPARRAKPKVDKRKAQRQARRRSR